MGERGRAVIAFGLCRRPCSIPCRYRQDRSERPGKSNTKAVFHRADPIVFRRYSLIERRLPDDPNETVRLIVSLLVRHSELSRIAIDSKARSISFYFIVRGAIGKGARAAFVR